MIQPLVGYFVTLTCRIASPVMTDDEEAVEHAERDRWHREEIHSRNRFPVVSKEGEPTFGGLGISRRPFHPTRDRALTEIKTEHAEFPMDPRCSPGGVLNDHAEDQFPNLLRWRPSSDLPPDSGDQPPAHKKTSPMPTNDGFRRDDDERLLPRRPDPPTNYPEAFIDESTASPSMPRLKVDWL